MVKIAVSWSGGKDSTMCLHTILQDGKYDVSTLITTVTETYSRVSMHGVREELLDRQAESLGIKLVKIYIPADCTNEVYERKMTDAYNELLGLGVEAVAYGDIFLEDVRRYREKNMKDTGLHPIFPIWGRNTRELAAEFLMLGYKAKIVCVDLNRLSESYVGREYDQEFLDMLPEDCDPCGENGEFHTFVYKGPTFKKSIQFTMGEKIVRNDRFCYQELIPI